MHLCCLTLLTLHLGVIAPWQENPRYWSDDGEPVLLLGGSDDDNLFQWPADQLIPQLDRMHQCGGNVIRNTMSDRNDRGFEVYAFAQLPNGKYDLERWNPEYWTRFERLLAETQKRNIYVQIEIWDRFDFTDNGGRNHWQLHPFRPQNNVNYSAQESGLASAYPDHPGANKQPLFFSTPAQRNNSVVLRYQQRFVDRLMSAALKYDHLLYCIDNETRAEEAWGKYWAEYIKAKAAAAGKSIYVTEMWDDWDLTAKRHRQTFDHPELYDFVDVSQNNHNRGQKHWDQFQFVRQYLEPRPRPINTTKTYGADGNKFGHSDQDAIERFWRHLLGGAASIRFHRPDSGLGLNDKAVRCLRAARKVEEMAPLWNLQPANEMLLDREENEAYCAADHETTAVVYFPKRGSVRFAWPEQPESLVVHWFNIDRDTQQVAQIDAAHEPIRLKPPSDGNWAAVITVVP